MTLLASARQTLARMLSVRDDQIDDALTNPRLARLAMDRRGFFRGVTAAAAALALPSGVVMAEVLTRAPPLLVYINNGWVEVFPGQLLPLLGGQVHHRGSSVAFENCRFTTDMVIQMGYP